MTEAEFADVRPGDVLIVKGWPSMPLAVTGRSDPENIEALFWDASTVDLKSMTITQADCAAFAIWEEA